MYYMFFFFNDPATTEIYTYCHTLSLHDALPILEESAVSTSSSGLPPAVWLIWPDEGAGIFPIVPAGAPCARQIAVSAALPTGLDPWHGSSARFASPVVIGVNRSEEHTSELQSLMRISYAVFCLKKKQTNTS